MASLNNSSLAEGLSISPMTASRPLVTSTMTMLPGALERRETFSAG